MNSIFSTVDLKRVKNENIVLLADRNFKKYDEINHQSESLEMIPDEYFSGIFDGLNSLAKTVAHYNTLESFIDNIARHKNGIVFTIYGGSRSRNRMALVPALCEAYNIRFVGADAYARIICQDKQISKEYCKRIGLTTPPYLLIEKHTDLQLIRNLEFPIVIKPNMEGSSIGIHDHCLVSNSKDAIALAKEMLQQFNQPLLAEQFVGGKEVCVCISGTTSEVKSREVAEVYIANNEKYFQAKLYTAFVKHESDFEIKHRIITPEISETELLLLNSVFLSLVKMDYMRIDGRVENGRFHLIELTPDPHLSSFSSFSESFKKIGLNYQEMLGSFICNALEYYQSPYSNK